MQGSVVKDDAALAPNSSLCAYLKVLGSSALDNIIRCPVVDFITKLVKELYFARANVLFFCFS